MIINLHDSNVSRRHRTTATISSHLSPSHLSPSITLMVVGAPQRASQLYLPSAALRESPNPIPDIDVFLSFLLFHFPLQSCLHHKYMTYMSYSFFTMVRRSACNPIASWILLRTSAIVTWSLYAPIASHLKGLDSSFRFCCKGPVLKGIKEGR